ncbi:hypothetical protein GCM10020256_68070 [Streptomyces thermocoprophilus]
MAADSEVYARMVDASGRGRFHRFYAVEGGTHVDALYDTWPQRLRPILPCYRSAFTALVAWVEKGALPPADTRSPGPRTVTWSTPGPWTGVCEPGRWRVSGRAPCV